ncbi:hypothetical protein BT69DRAFT_1225450, partial [Atractiella rhizophila]
RATWWDVEDSELACGGYNKLTDFVVAMNFPQYGNPNARSVHCNKKVTITYQGKSTTATVRDACAGCAYGSLDMSPALFKFFEPLDVGVFQCVSLSSFSLSMLRCDVVNRFDWVFADGSGGDDSGDDSGDNEDDSPKTTKKPDPTTTEEEEEPKTTKKPDPTTSEEDDEPSTTKKPQPTTTKEEDEPTTTKKPKPTTSEEDEPETTSTKEKETSTRYVHFLFPGSAA